MTCGSVGRPCGGGCRECSARVRGASNEGMARRPCGATSTSAADASGATTFNEGMARRPCGVLDREASSHPLHTLQ